MDITSYILWKHCVKSIYKIFNEQCTVPLNKLIHKGYTLDVVVRIRKLVFVGTYINTLIA